MSLALIARVAARFTLPRESYLPKEVRGTPPNVDPQGTDLAIWTYESPNVRTGEPLLLAIAFAAKQNKPMFHNSFRSEASRQAAIRDAIDSRKRVLEYKQKQLEERRNYQHGIQVGEIYNTSWGYDQTNVDFYEVVEIRGKDILVREVAKREVSTDKNVTMVAPQQGKYVSGPVRARPTPGGSFKVDGHNAHKWSGKPVYETTSGWGH